MGTVRFGTSGWRAIIAEDFTFRNVEAVARAIGEVAREDSPAGDTVSLAIGYDGRFLSESFARTCALVLCADGVKVLLPRHVVPTPVISYVVRALRLTGGIVVTASHNPPEYNGLKYSPADGAPASPEVTRRIEMRANAHMAETVSRARFPAAGAAQQELVDAAVRNRDVEWLDPYEAYRAHLFNRVQVDILRRARLRVVADVFYGAGRGYLPQLLQDAGCQVTALHEEANPLFGGRRPDPLGENVRELAQIVRESDAVLGLAVDGDADRFGIVDGDGCYIAANYVLALLFDYLVESRGWRGEVVRSVVTSHLLDAVAAARGVSVHQTPTGFKFIGARLVDNPHEFILGGEESNGLTIRGHVPEKDGVLACLLVAEMVAARGQSLRACLGDLFSHVGERCADRLDLELGETDKQALLRRLAENPPHDIGGLAVSHVERLDGFKFLLADGGFVAFRASGTEPLVRCYLDATGRAALDAMRGGVRAIVGSV
jgi:phosphoglucomutase